VRPRQPDAAAYAVGVTNSGWSSTRGQLPSGCLSKKTVEAHGRTIFLKLDLTMSPDDDRRVLAVPTVLRSMP